MSRVDTPLSLTNPLRTPSLAAEKDACQSSAYPFRRQHREVVGSHQSFERTLIPDSESLFPFHFESRRFRPIYPVYLKKTRSFAGFGIGT